ncbi:MAG: hypothetical protein HY329_03680 [Chloroflexi bacterium]|nr:hypothetical protein [Chloroflexota bacterium]
MAGIVYVLCAITALACAALLFRSYVRNRAPLLLWSGLCFAGLTLNNALVFVDLMLVPTVDLSLLRNATALAAIALLLYGLIWNAE